MYLPRPVLILASIYLMQQSTVAQGPTLACGGTSLLKSTTLIAPDTIATNGGSCVYNIRAINLRVCQLRIDFNSFSLAQPAEDPFPKCTDDTLSIENLNFNLCGENSGQHLYVPFTPTNSDRDLSISFQIASRLVGSPVHGRPYWNIRVQQLECPVGAAYASKVTIRGGAEGGPLARALFHNENGPLAKTFHNDNGLLAPPGCLQFFTSTVGVVESFNMGNGIGPYLGDMNYAMCFARSRTNTGIRFHPSVFEVGSSGDHSGSTVNPGFDEACYSNVASVGRSEDNLHIPNAVVMLPSSPTIRASRFCARSLLDANVDATSPGPFVIYFSSDRLYDGTNRPETGFRMRYEIV